jgi:hypothetical protein
MKIDLRISIKDYRREKLENQTRVGSVRRVFLCRLPTALRKSLVKPSEAVQ